MEKGGGVRAYCGIGVTGASKQKLGSMVGVRGSRGLRS